MTTDQTDIKQLISAQIATLPAPVRNAITSSEIEHHLRSLADKHKLHFDQWDALEQEVMLTLLGVHPIEELEINIASEVGIQLALAHDLADDISKIIFEPIRQELERQLEHPDAQAKEVSGIEAARQQQLQSSTPVQPISTTPTQSTQTMSLPAVASTPLPAPTVSTAATATAPAPAPVVPATPPTPAPDIKVTRPSESSEYRPGEISGERKAVVDDPYREPIN